MKNLKRAERLARHTEFLELAALPEFQDEFVDQLEFPEDIRKSVLLRIGNRFWHRLLSVEFMWRRTIMELKRITADWKQKSAFLK